MKIFILWLAGFLAVGHAFIPHHHHDIETHQCHEHENHTDGHKIILHDLSTFSSLCSCEHSHETDNICHFSERTIVNKSKVSVALIVSIPFSFDFQCSKNITLPDIARTHKDFLWVHSDTGRAPPKV